MAVDEVELLARWRLVLGKQAEEHHITCGGIADLERIDQLIGFLFEPGMGQGGANTKTRTGTKGRPQITIPEWVDGVTELFPHSAKEVLERELIQRRGIAALLDQPDLLEKVEPNVELVKTLLTHKDLLNPNTRMLAQKIIAQVVQQLKEKMKLQVESTITGAIRRDRHSPRRVVRNLDVKTTIRRNLKNYDTDNERLLVNSLFFYASERNKRPWHVIIAVDQSGSMLDSAIFSAVMASIFYELPSIRTSMFLFSTEVVDMTALVGQPMDVLMSVQLGGGTDITQAMVYGQQLVREPTRTIVVVITDFYEGRAESDLIRQVQLMAESGIRMIGLGALGYDARPAYNRTLAKKLTKVGMDILVSTPEKLAESMAQIIRG